MTADGHAIAAAMLATLLVGLLGAGATMWLARRSATTAAAAAPLVAVLSVAAGVWSGASTMLFDKARLQVLMLVVAATIPIAMLVGAVQARRVRAIDAERLRQESDRREAVEVDRVRREVVAAVSHDLRTPLAGIRAMVEALEDGIAEDPADYLRRIHRETDRTAAMVDDLLALTSLSVGGTATPTEAVDVADLISDTLASVGPAAAAAQVRLAGRVDGDGGAGGAALVVDGDVRRLSRAFLNLVVNAVQHTAPGGAVTVTARRLPGSVEVAVADECGGIAPADLESVFAPGWRGSAARTPDRGPLTSSGAGLGLSIVQAVVDQHGGHVEVGNVPGGCRFVVTLPTNGPSRP